MQQRELEELKELVENFFMILYSNRNIITLNAIIKINPKYNVLLKYQKRNELYLIRFELTLSMLSGFVKSKSSQ